jgi:hypothetical protein
MGSSLAPNLKEVALHYGFTYDFRIRYVPPSWKGFSQEAGEISKKSCGNLRYLRFQNIQGLVEDRLDYWSLQTDSTKLQALEFATHLTSDSFRHPTTKFQLLCLEKLVLSNHGNGLEVPSDYAKAVNEFLRRLPPLKSVTLVTGVLRFR